MHVADILCSNAACPHYPGKQIVGRDVATGDPWWSWTSRIRRIRSQDVAVLLH